MSERIYGIDFGTTNSCIAVFEPEGPRVLEIDGHAIVPSVVGFDPENGEVIVGRRARNREALRPEETVRSIKRRMGSEESLVIGSDSYLPEQVAAEILRYLKTEGEKALATEIRRAVITVPAFFEDAQRRATIRAGELAGLEVVRILNEPTAAALLYDRLEHRGAGRSPAQANQNVLVYDLGGGTFDVSIVRLGEEIQEVLASCGDNHLGGDDFDHRLAEHLKTHLSLDGESELPLAARIRLREAAEKAKIDLSHRPFTRVTEEALLGDRHLDEEVSRSTLEELLADLLGGTLAKVDEALAEARLEPDQIDRVVLVGGSTAMPRIHELLTERFDCPVDHAIDPALCVALGAAVQGAVLEGRIFDHILVDVAPHSLGVKVLSEEDDIFSPRYRSEGPDTFAPLIRRNSQIPASHSEVFYSVADGQERVSIEVYQGESSRCSENTLIGEFLFELEPAPAGCEIVDELSYDLDGIVRVRVDQRGYDNRREVTMDTRQAGRAAADVEASAQVGGEEVDNYILRKARNLAAELAESPLRERLVQATEAYEAALRGDEEAEVDRAEDTLLELLESAQETLEEWVEEKV